MRREKKEERRKKKEEEHPEALVRNPQTWLGSRVVDMPPTLSLVVLFIESEVIVLFIFSISMLVFVSSRITLFMVSLRVCRRPNVGSGPC